MSQGVWRRTAVVITTLRHEAQAVLAHLKECTARDEQGTYYEVGRFTGEHGAWTVAVVEIGPGNAPAAAELERAIHAFSPEVILLVGVAGGLKDLGHGDVVAADAVYDFESGKESDEDLQPRFKSHHSSYPLVQRARAVARQARWQRLIKPSTPDAPPVAVVKPVASGSKVVASARAQSARLLRDLCGDAVAVEMEGHGFLVAAYRNRSTDALVIRGISDLLDDKDAANDERWQPIASSHAAAFAFAVLDNISRTPGGAERPPKARSRRAVIASAAALTMVATFVLIWLGLGQFYAAMGVDVNRLPIRFADQIAPALFGLAFIAALLVVMVGPYAVGALLGSWPRQSRVTAPAAALSFSLFCSTVLANAVSDLEQVVSQAIISFMGMVLLGVHYRLTLRQRLRDVFLGYGVATAPIAVVYVSAAGLNRLDIPQPWPVVALISGCVLICGLCGLWLWMALRRETRLGGSEIEPRAVLAELLDDLRPVSGLGGATSWGKALISVLFVLVIPLAAIVIGVWAVGTWFDERATAGRLAVEYGYLPIGHGSMVMDTPVQPVLVSLRHQGVDPSNACGQAASLLATEADASWVLLRPIVDGRAQPARATVVRLAAADYTIRLIPTGEIEKAGAPWVTPACG